MKLVSIFLFLIPKILFSQFQTDSINGERLYNLKELSMTDTPDSVSFPFYQIDSVTQTPINGWVKNKGEDYIIIEHYKNGLSNVKYVKYELINNKFKKTYSCLRHQGWTYESYDYKWKNDSIKLIKVFYKKWTDDYHLRREIRIKTTKNKLKDTYYFYESHKKKNIRYSLDSINQFTNGLRGVNFPNVLNEIENPFIAIRFDGYYNYRVFASKKNVAKWHPLPDTLYPKYYNENDTTVQLDSTFSFDIKIRFYPNGTYKHISTTVANNDNNWNSTKIYIGKYTIEDNFIQSKNSTPGFEIIKAEFFGLEHNIIECGYANGVKHRYVFEFIIDN